MVDKVPTFCRICEAGCGLVAHVEGDQVLELTPDRDHVVSRGYACVKGIRYRELQHSPDRLETPLKRVGDGFEPIGWEQALTEIGRKLKRIRDTHGPESIGVYAGNPIAFNLPHQLFLGGLVRGLGTHQVYGAGSQDCNNKFAAAEAMYGSPLLQPIPDFDHVRCFVIIGSNPAVSQMSFLNAPRPIERLRALEKRGGKVVFVNPRRTESARQVGEQVFIRPGTDVFFLLAFLHEVFARDAVDPRAARHLEHLEELRALVAPWTPERSEAVTRIPAATLRALVESYCEADGAALYASTGLNQGDHGTLAFWLLSAINAVTGNLDRRGGTLVPRGAAYWMHLAGAKLRQSRSRIGGFASVLETLPAGLLPDEILTPGEGQLRAMIVSAGNPVLSCASQARMEQAFRSLELLVSIDLFRNETGELADYVLPASSFLERDDTPLSMQGWQPVAFAQYTPRVVPPLGEAKEEWWIYTRLLDAMGLRMFDAAHRYLAFSTREGLPRWLRRLQFSPTAIFRGMLALHGLTPARAARKHPHGKRVAGARPGSFLGRWVPRPGGKVDVAPQAYVEAMDELERAFEEELRRGHELKLISKRERHTHNTWLHNVDSLVKGSRGTNHLHLHPEDAARLGLRPGALAEVRSEHGRITLPVQLSDDLMPGVVAVPHGWGRRGARGLRVAQTTGGANVNVLAGAGPESLERHAGMTRLTGLRVQVEAVTQATVDGRPTPAELAE